MSDTLESLRAKKERAHDLSAVVSTMKALAASSIGQYESAVQSLEHYYRTVELGLVACLRDSGGWGRWSGLTSTGKIGAVVFGSDQGLVGGFNASLCLQVVSTLEALPGEKKVWAVGERIAGNLTDAGLQVVGVFQVPNSVRGIDLLVNEVLLHGLVRAVEEKHSQVHTFHNQLVEHGRYEPRVGHLLPRGGAWVQQFSEQTWPTQTPPQLLGGSSILFRKLVQEYLFVSLYRACAESLMCENRIRLSSMQRAEKNIQERLEHLTQQFHRLRQNAIDEELFDLISGFEAVGKGQSPKSSF